MTRASAAWAIPTLGAYVALSSVLGLHQAQVDDFAAFFVQVWSSSLAADAVFVLGSMATGWAAFALARERAWLPGLLTGLGGTYLTYLASVVLLMGPDAMHLVAMVGWPGLLFGALAPVFAAWYVRTASRVDVLATTLTHRPRREGPEEVRRVVVLEERPPVPGGGMKEAGPADAPERLSVWAPPAGRGRARAVSRR